MRIVGKIKPQGKNLLILPYGKIKAGLNFDKEYEVSIEQKKDKRSIKQNNTYWGLVTLFCQVETGEKSVSEYEKRYKSLELLNEYGLYDDQIGFFTDIKLYTKEAMTVLLSTLFGELAKLSDKPYFVAGKACEAFEDFQEYLGYLNEDPNDYYATDGQFKHKELDEQEWRNSHTISQASGLGGDLHLHHIHGRKARADLSNRSWNWLMLTPEEHSQLHTLGQINFIKAFPHLRGRFARADKLSLIIQE